MVSSKAEPGPAEHSGGERLPGYAECHFCTVRRKRRAWRCIFCVGRQDLRERILRGAEEKIRRRVATVFSLLMPGLGHFYRSSPGTGFFFFSIIAAVAIYFIAIEGEMTSGRWFLIGSMVLVYIAQAVDAGRGPGGSEPPCQKACPAGLACMKYVGLIREGKNRDALQLVEVGCPFPGTVGRVCHHPCEQNCRRAEEGEAIAICALKRYLADNAADNGHPLFRGEMPQKDVFSEKIAVIGGGPAGLSAALYLRLMGFPVTIFEASEKIGGMPGSVIPDYRLPGYVFREEVERILGMGIEVRTGRAVGRDFSLRDVRKEGYAAAFLALGAQRSVRLPHCGSIEEGFLDGLEFLRASKAGTAEKLHGTVLVIGGGNVAVDVAKTAVRMGAERVLKVFLETRETMPAHPWECEEALEEGVEIVPASATVSFEMERGRVRAALCRKVRRIDIDEKGRIRPVLQDETDFILEADWVITAVGNGPDYGLFEGPPKMKPLRSGIRAGRLHRSLSPGIPVVVGGDYYAGPSSVIEAIAAGCEAACAIYRSLHKVSLLRRPAWNRLRRVKFPGYFDEPGKARRKHVVKADPEVRCESFCETCESYDDDMAVEEAARCLRCCWPMEPVKGPPKAPAKVVEVPPVATSPEEKQFY